MGGLFASIKIPGNRLTDMVGQTSTVGKPIGFGFGKVLVEDPNVIWTAGIPKEHVKKKKQGKGGVKTEEYTYTLSYAIAFIEGPVSGFFTIKRGGKVVFTTDPSATVEDKQYAAKWRQKARLYLGGESQMPDSTIESYVGAGKVSAFRGLCYIVVIDDDVTAESGAVPQYEAVIIASPPDVYLTSKPYAYVDRTGVNLAHDFTQGYQVSFQIDELSFDQFDFEEGRHREVTQILPIAEAIVPGNSFDFEEGQLKSVLTIYDRWPQDKITGGTSFYFDEGTHKVVLLPYNNWPTEGLAFNTFDFPDGTIS